MCSMFAIGQVTDFETFHVKKNQLKYEQLHGSTPMAYELIKYHANKPQLQVYASKSEVASDKAEVILEAHKVFGEFAQIGFQMLLDADATAYDDLFYEWSNSYYGDYESFEYKIPENADASHMSENVIIDGSVAIEIPEGIYDFMIAYPFPGDGIYITNGDYAKVDNFEFKGGYTYRFVVEYVDADGGWMMDMAFLYVDVDAAVTKLNVPDNGMDLTDSEEISIEITNRGTSAISNFNVSYKVDESEAVTESFTGTIEAGQTASYTFEAKADLSEERKYTITAWTSLEGDMISSNDEMSAVCKHIGVSQLPFAYDFSNPGDFSFDWVVQDVNGDGSTWQFNEWTMGPDDLEGAASCNGRYDEDRTGNDNMISLPIQLPAGPSHMILYTRCVNGIDATELLDVRYGKTTNVDEMTIIADYAINEEEWIERVINFNVEEEGIYYFAFHAKSVDGMNVFVDNITIDAGEKEVAPSLTITDLVLPYSNCDLSNETLIGVELKNMGTGASSEFELSYKVNDGSFVTETFTAEILPIESETVYFTTTADLSEVGEYEIFVTAEIDNEDATSRAETIVNYEPITDLPIEVSFSDGETYKNYWTAINEEAWSVDPWMGVFGSDMTGVENALITHCFYLENSIRMRLQYAQGGWGMTSFYVAYGKTGENIENYTKVYEDDYVEGENDVEFMINITESDNYNVVIVNTSGPECTLYLNLCEFSNVSQYDLKIEDVTYPAANYTPSIQLSAEGEYVATISNRGLAEMTGVKLSLYDGETLLTESAGDVNIASDQTAKVSLKAQLPQQTVGNQLNLTVKVEADEEDAYLGDNVYEIKTINVTKDLYATENMENIEYGTGSWGDTLYIGNVYTLTAADILKTVVIGFSPIDEMEADVASKQIGLSIYTLDADYNIENLVAHTEFERGFGGFVEAELDPMRLEPATYYFEVQQLTTYNMGLGYDPEDVENYCYQNVYGTLQKVEGAAIAVRAKFNSNLTVYEKDAAVMKFVAPVKESTLFSDNETVSFMVKNKGYAAADVPVRLSLGSANYDVEVALRPYEEKVISFDNIDMQEVGEYVFIAKTMLEGDENTENDELTKTYTTVEEANPYVMDFESCYDFDAAPDVFNPRWTTVDRNNEPTDYFWMFEHQYRGEPVGFIAFNPESTVPVITPENLPGFTPNSGKRFGVAFCAGYEAMSDVSDIWLMSPKLKLGKDSNLELYVKTRYIESMDQENEKYRLLISDTDNEFESFVVLGDDERRAAEEWEKVEVDLAEYDGKEVYVAIQYIGERFKNVCLMVDDIKVNTTITDGVDDILSDDIKVFHNQNTLKIKSESNVELIEIVNMKGQVVEKMTNLGNGDVNISTENYVSGVYITNIYTSSGSKTAKFVVR